MLLLFAGIADFGRVFYGYVALENAVREGALYGARYPLCDDESALCPDPANVRWRVENEAAKAGGETPDVMTWSECRRAGSNVVLLDLRQCEAGDTYRVSATFEFQPLTPIIANLVGPQLTIRSAATAVVLNEAFDPTPGLAVTKLVRVDGSGGSTPAKNSAEIVATCQMPDVAGSPGYYRSPCIDESAVPGPDIEATFEPGDRISYKILLENIGEVRVTGVRLTDSRGSTGCGAPPSTMGVGGTRYECRYDRTAPNVSGAGNSSAYTNEVTVEGNEIDPTADAVTVTIERPPADLRVLKFVSPYRDGADGDGRPSFGTNRNITVRFNAQVPSPFVWYRIVVTNRGGRAATGLQLADTFGPLPFGQRNATADCDAQPATLNPGASFICKYRRSFTTAGVFPNTVTATSPEAPPDSDDSMTARVTVQSCTGSNRVVPNLIGLTKAQASAAWTAAGFTRSVTSWNGNNSAVAVAQDRVAFTCASRRSSIRIFRIPTP